MDSWKGENRLNPQTRLEILEAFASSKPTEFDGFTHAYIEAHPEQPEPIIAAEPIVYEAPKRKRKTTPEPDTTE